MSRADIQELFVALEAGTLTEAQRAALDELLLSVGGQKAVLDQVGALEAADS